MDKFSIYFEKRRKLKAFGKWKFNAVENYSGIIK
jgi:hypothetical protein